MIAVTTSAADGDLDDAFDYYEAIRAGLGDEFLIEFRRAVDRILEHPNAWQKMNERNRRCQLHRFPYGVMYHLDEAANQIVIKAVMHMQRDPQRWYR